MPEEDRDDADERGGGRKMDTELRSIASIIRTLDDLPDDARGRVVAYLASRYQQRRD